MTFDATTQEDSRQTPISSIEDPNRIVRSRLDREDELLMQRTTWLVGSQAFLFTGYAITLNGLCTPPSLPITQAHHQVARLNVLLPWASLMSLLVLYMSMIAGIVTTLRLRQQLRASPDTQATEASKAARLAGLAAPALVPLIFLLTWIAVVWSPG